MGAGDQLPSRAGEAHLLPGPLSIFYGWPSLVNGAGGDPGRAAEQFARFEAVVFGDATPTAAGDPRGAAVVQRLQGRCRVYGYLSLGTGPGQPDWAPDGIRRQLAAWAEWGADGMLLDCAGRDFGVPPDRLALGVDAVHQLEMDTVVNAWDPGDLVASGGHFGPSDGYLAENDVLRHGVLRPLSAFTRRLGAVDRLRRCLGIRIWATATTSSWWVPGRYATAVAGQVAAQWAASGARPPDLLAIADPLYGAVGNRMPLPELPELPELGGMSRVRRADRAVVPGRVGATGG
jgi:hypothetical protein